MDRIRSPIARHLFNFLHCFHVGEAVVDGSNRRYYTRIKAGIVVIVLKEHKEATYCYLRLTFSSIMQKRIR